MMRTSNGEVRGKSLIGRENSKYKGHSTGISPIYKPLGESVWPCHPLIKKISLRII